MERERRRRSDGIIFTMNFLTELLLSTVRMATPILLVALAETYSERAGMVNIGLDGIMAIGALVGFLVGYETGSPWAGVLAGALSGIATNMIYAFCTITLCAEQTVYGMAINILLRRWHLLFTGFPFLIRLH